MPEAQAQLVIEISASHAVAGHNSEPGNCGLGPELGRSLRPGVEIALAFPGYTAVMSILWISELQQNQSFRAGVRLLGVSALPAETNFEL